MCGIVGAVSRRDVVPFLLEGLRRLEYRGYDSAGIAVLGDGIRMVRSVGRVAQMQSKALSENLHGIIGIGHTRWATHGGVTEPNAHPHVSSGEIAVVHNGIIENHESHRSRLITLGYKFESQTDTEVIAHLIHYHFKLHNNLLRATSEAVRELIGAYAISVMCVQQPGVVVCARQGCPLLIGLGEGENYVASDVSAVLAETRRVIYLEDGDVAELSEKGVIIVDTDGVVINRKINVSEISLASMQLGTYTHYMQKEIHEQPQAVIDTMKPIMDLGFSADLFGSGAQQAFEETDSVLILAAGTSYYAGLVAKFWLETIAHIPTTVEIASEYRYRESIPSIKQLVVTISQSGETLDTFEALKHAQSLGHVNTLSICNVQESTIPRASSFLFYTRAGPEIGVASTKAFTTQLIGLFALAVTLASQHSRLTTQELANHMDVLRHLPDCIQYTLNLEPQIRAWARIFSARQHALFLGRGMHFPIALEGALKLKEISYIHAEAYPAGELKHGPLALVDKNMPVVVIAPNGVLLEKIKSNMQEVSARGGELFVFMDEENPLNVNEHVHVIRMPPHESILSPVVYAVSVQLLAYHTAVQCGTDVDKPRNLAKSVTVE